MDGRLISIVVRGALGPDLRAALDGFVVTTADGLTRIVGVVPDQSRLFGLLAMFDALHVEVVSVNPLEERT